MITTKEKAIEIVINFENKVGLCKDDAIDCAYVCVQEILNEFPQGYSGNFEAIRKAWWEDVKIEISEL